MKKVWSIIRWVIIAILLQIILIPLSYIIFPASYYFRDKIRGIYYDKKGVLKILISLLWIFLDDEEFERQGHDYGEPWWRKAKGLEINTKWQRFKTAYLWNVVRNPAWNQYTLIKPSQGDIEVIKSNGALINKNMQLSELDFAVLKWVDEEGEYMDNKGHFISNVYSIFGKMFVWYKVQNRLYWRYSFAGKKFNRWIEVQIGTTDLRYTIRFKIKKGEIYERKML